MLLPDGVLNRAKIIDFGIAKSMELGAQTVVGDGFAGKLGYVAPEQFGDFDRRIGPWTDIYSLGLVVLALAGGKAARHGRDLGRCDRPPTRGSRHRCGADAIAAVVVADVGARSAQSPSDHGRCDRRASTRWTRRTSPRRHRGRSWNGRLGTGQRTSSAPWSISGPNRRPGKPAEPRA
ncbi:protein kinase domain-containing protein [Caulobacter segnis]